MRRCGCRAAGLAGGRRQPWRDRVLSSRPVAAGPGGRGAPGSRGRRPHAVDHGARLPGAGRDAAGDRTGRGQVAHHVPRSARQPARRPVPPADRRQPYRAATPPDVARGGRLELGAAHRRRTDGPAQARGVLRRGEPGRGRAGLRRRCGRAGAGARVADRADREIAAASPRGTAHRATGCSTRSGNTPGTGSRRRGNRTWRAMRIWRTSPDSPRPRTRICAAPTNWNGWPRSSSSMTTSPLPCVARSRPARRTGRCGSRRPPAGTGGSAATRPRASS